MQRFNRRSFLGTLPVAAAAWHATAAAGDPLAGAIYEVPSKRQVEPPQIGSLTHSRDGKTLALGLGSSLLLHDAATGKEVLELAGHKERIAAATFSAAGTRLATASFDQTARIWDAATGNELVRLYGHRGKVHAVAFAPDGKTVATGGEDLTVRLWDVDEGRELKKYTSHFQAVHAVAFSPDGKLLASGGQDRSVHVRDLCDHRLVFRFQRHADLVKALLILADGATLVSASQDGAVRAIDLSTGRDVRRIGGWAKGVRAVAISSDGRTVATMHDSGTLCLRELATGEERLKLKCTERDHRALAFSPDLGRLVSAGPDLVAWDATGLWRDGKPAEVQVSGADLDALWSDLAGLGPVPYRAARRLAAVPLQSVPFFRKQFVSVVEFDAPARVARLLADLDSHQFTTRQLAHRDLEALGRLAEPALHEALARGPSLELRRRLEKLTDPLKKATELLPPISYRPLRAIEALEWMRTDAARTLLKELAGGMASRLIRDEAGAALKRLAG